MAYWLAWKEPCAVGDLVHVGSSLRGTWEVSSVPGRVPGRLGKATSRTPSMYVDEKSDEP